MGIPRCVLADVQQPGAGLHQGRREVQGEGRQRHLRRVRERLLRDEVRGSSSIMLFSCLTGLYSAWKKHLGAGDLSNRACIYAALTIIVLTTCIVVHFIADDTLRLLIARRTAVRRDRLVGRASRKGVKSLLLLGKR